MGYFDEYTKAIERSRGFKGQFPCNGLKDVDKLFASIYACKKQDEAAKLQKTIDATFKKANSELRAAVNKFDESTLIPPDFPPFVKLQALEKELLAEEKTADKKLDDLLEKLP